MVLSFRVGVLAFALSLAIGCRGSTSNPAPERDASPAVAATTASAAAPVLLFDPSAPERPVAIDARTATLLAKLFPKRDAGKAKGACLSDLGDLEAARKAGEIDPEVTSLVRGAFTRVGAVETAYAVALHECNAGGWQGPGSTRLVVLRGDTVVLNTEVTFHRIEKAADLDGDGRAELVVTSGGMGQGVIVQNADLVRIDADTARVVHSFGEVYTSPCGSGAKGAQTAFTRIYSEGPASGGMASFKIEAHSEACPP